MIQTNFFLEGQFLIRVISTLIRSPKAKEEEEGSEPGACLTFHLKEICFGSGSWFFSRIWIRFLFKNLCDLDTRIFSYRFFSVFNWKRNHIFFSNQLFLLTTNFYGFKSLMLDPEKKFLFKISDPDRIWSSTREDHGCLEFELSGLYAFLQGFSLA